MGDLTTNLSRGEFACKCGCGFDTVDYELILVVQRIRDYMETPVTINSGCRCQKYNHKIGGSLVSKHLQGRAADCDFSGIAPTTIWNLLLLWFPDKFGFGLYTWGVHIDTRTNGPARWT